MPKFFSAFDLADVLLSSNHFASEQTSLSALANTGAIDDGYSHWRHVATGC